MLTLSRKRAEDIIIAGNIRVMVVEVLGDKVRLGIEAPKEIPVHRGEVYRRIQAEGESASARGREGEKTIGTEGGARPA